MSPSKKLSEKTVFESHKNKENQLLQTFLANSHFGFVAMNRDRITKQVMRPSYKNLVQDLVGMSAIGLRRKRK